jgi:DNA-binding LacI/PurR family transcriptional regulator
MTRSRRSTRDGVASVTVEDVAKRAGVSRATVSRVVNVNPRVSPEARLAVTRAIEELRYVPNPAARALMTRRSDSVAVVILESANRLFEDPYFNQLLLGISGGLADHEVQLVLLIAQSALEEERLERYIAAGHVDGAMIIGPRGDDELPRRLVARGVPVVVNGRPSGEEAPGNAHALSYVDVENREGARVAVAHLAAGGRRRIATIHGPLDLASGRDRLDGYREGLEAAHLQVDPGLEEGGGYIPPLAADAMGSLLARFPDLDAVFAASDSMAAAAIGVLLDAGRRVPEDVAVVGFDDSPVAMTVRPTLTTVRQPIGAMGRELAELLMRQISDPAGSPSRVIFPTELVVRESSARVAGTAGEPAARNEFASPGAVTPELSPPGDGR